MEKNSFLKILLVGVILMSIGSAVLASENDIPEPRIECHPKVADFEIPVPEVFPLVSKSGTVSMASFDLRSFDLSESEDLLKETMFDTRTIWPEKMPESFDPVEVMNWGKNPGLGLKKLHQAGITGKGVNIAILDAALFLEHEQWADRIKMYEQINISYPYCHFHSTGVTSVAAGKTTGIAPEANIYFIAHETDHKSTAKAIRRIIDVNKILSAEDKIKVISISQPFLEEYEGYEETQEAIKAATNTGIFIISGSLFETHKMYYYGLDIDLLKDRDNLSSYRPISWPNWLKKVSGTSFKEKYTEHFKRDVNENCQLLFIPCDRMTVAARGVSHYIFYRNNGWSHVIPYVAGLYALTCQVKPDITPEIFWQTALETGEEMYLQEGGKNYPGKIVNPTKLIAKLKDK